MNMTSSVIRILASAAITAVLMQASLASDKVLQLQVSDDPEDNCSLTLEPNPSLMIESDGSVIARVVSLANSDCVAGEGNAARLFLSPNSVQTGGTFQAVWVSTAGNCQASTSSGTIGGTGWSGAKNQEDVQTGLVAPSTAGTYQLILNCDSDVSAQASLQVSAPPPEPVAISAFNFRVNSGTTQPAQNLTVDEGANLRISWSTSNATSCEALGTLNGWTGASIPVSGSRDVTLGSEGGTVRLRCVNSNDASSAETQTFEVTVQPPVPQECANRRPSNWQRQTDCIFNDSTRDCTSYEAVFGSWPGTPNARQFFLRQNHYVAMRFVPPANMSSNFEASISVEEPQFGLSSTGTKIFTISRCPGDFDRAKITEEMGTQRCYFRQITAGDSFLFGGLTSQGSFRCKFAPPPNGEPLYLNIVYTDDPAGTNPTQLNWGCGGDTLCANRFAIGVVQ